MITSAVTFLHLDQFYLPHHARRSGIIKQSSASNQTCEGFSLANDKQEVFQRIYDDAGGFYKRSRPVTAWKSW